MKTVHLITVLTALVLSQVGCGQKNKSEDANMTPMMKSPSSEVNTSDTKSKLTDIVDTAVSAGSFTTLAKVLTAAGLIDTLKGDGPFTVFAPTDEAFAKLPEGTVEALLADIPTLKSILLYHVLAGKLEAKDVLAQNVLQSISAVDLNVSVVDGSAYINNSKITATDVQTSNGVIHVIDSVLIPSK
jgi:uncharacterized surface protein with fasciclin (FAS1) repeats